jgi:hypothetical protein
MIMAKCKICDSVCREFGASSPLGQEYRVECPRCGEYEITDVAKDVQPEEFVRTHLYLLSGLARNSWDRRKRIRVDARLLKDRAEFEARVLTQCPRSVLQKADYTLRYLADASSYPGAIVTIDPMQEYPKFYCRNNEELRFHLHGLQERQLLTFEPTGRTLGVRLTGIGWQRAEELQRPNIESKQAFVAMWFDKQLDSAFAQGILKLEEDTGFRPLRIDMKQFNDKICDHIIVEIRRSRFIIADVTGQRQGVYFEAGFAMGLGLPVIWTCRKDQINECHFDTRQYNHITWETPEELREKLKDRILATIGSPH